MQVRERPVNLSEMMGLFETVHQNALLDAYRSLQAMPPYARWRIALQEKLMPITYEIIAQCEICWVVDLKLDRQRKRLEIADEASQKAIEAWEKRNHDALPWQFEVPMFAAGEVDGRGNGNQAGTSDVR